MASFSSRKPSKKGDDSTLEIKSGFVAWRTRIDSLTKKVNGSIMSKDFMIGKWCWVMECYKQNNTYSRENTAYFRLKARDTQTPSVPIASLIVHVFSSKDYPITTKEFKDLKIPYISSTKEKEPLQSNGFSYYESVPNGSYNGSMPNGSYHGSVPNGSYNGLMLNGSCNGSVPNGSYNGLVILDMNNLDARTPVTFGLEFLDLKVQNGKDGRIYSIWNEEYSLHRTLNEPISRMLSESIYTDIVINAIDGSIGAHRAVLAANSPVFKVMFSENYKEKQTATVNMDDMSIGACKAMLNFFYGQRNIKELRAYSMSLMIAADKYDIVALKKTCEATFCKDVGANNVFQKLIYAHAKELPELKSTCLFYLVKMGMIFKLREEYNSFLREANPELVVLVSNACLDAI